MSKGKIKNLIIGVFGLSFSIFGLIFMDKSEIMTWVAIVFFGSGAVFLLFRYFNPDYKANQNIKKDFEEIWSSKGILKYNNLGFQVLIDDNIIDVNWEEVERIIAFKTDELVVDKLCLFIEIGDNKSFQIDEQTDGWFVFVKNMKERFPEMNQNWEIDIADPPFERNETELYSRYIKN